MRLILAVVSPQEATTADRCVTLTDFSSVAAETMHPFDKEGRRHGDLYNR